MESRDPAELRQYLAVTAEAKARGIHPNHRGEVIGYPDSHDPKHGEGLNARQMKDDILIRALKAYHRKGENLGYMGEKRKELVLEHGYDSKNAAHCVRLLRMAKEIFETGGMTVYRGPTGTSCRRSSAGHGRWPRSRLMPGSCSRSASARTTRRSCRKGRGGTRCTRF
jgi:hypothetical protein